MKTTFLKHLQNQHRQITTENTFSLNSKEIALIMLLVEQLE